MSDCRTLPNENNNATLSDDKVALLNQMLQKKIIDPLQIIAKGHRHASFLVKQTTNSYTCGLRWVKDSNDYRLQSILPQFGLDYVRYHEALTAFPDSIKPFVKLSFLSGCYTSIICSNEIPLTLLKEALYPSEKTKKELSVLARHSIANERFHTTTTLENYDKLEFSEQAKTLQY